MNGPIDRHDDVPSLVFAGGEPIDPVLQTLLPNGRYTVAADSGLDQAAALGRAVDAVVGDMDSVDPDLLREARDSGITIEVHPTDKDATDLELALDHLVERGSTSAIIAGGDGGRLDHLLGNALLITSDRFDGIDIQWWLGTTRVLVVRPGTALRISGSPGDRVSLLAVGGDATGVTTTGLEWTLADELLPSGSTRGISNELTDEEATIALVSGRLLAIHERTSSP